jgi:hypothetical protein
MVSLTDIMKNANITKEDSNSLEIIEGGLTTLYHVARGIVKPKIKIPVNVPRTSLMTENNTILRISVAEDILDCINGARGTSRIDMWELHSHTEYGIYKVSTPIYAKPGTKLISDAEETNERWLINYDGEHTFYTFDKIGAINPIAYYYTKNKLVTEKETKDVYILLLTLDSDAYFNGEPIKAGNYKVICWQDLDNINKKNQGLFVDIKIKIIPYNDKKKLFDEYFTIESRNGLSDLIENSERLSSMVKLKDIHLKSHSLKLPI